LSVLIYRGQGKMEEGGSQEIKVWEAGELEGSDPLLPPSPPQKKIVKQQLN